MSRIATGRIMNHRKALVGCVPRTINIGAHSAPYALSSYENWSKWA